MEIKKLFNLEIKWASRESKQSNNYLSDTPRPQYKTADEISWIQMHQQVQTKRKLGLQRFHSWTRQDSLSIHVRHVFSHPKGPGNCKIYGSLR